MIGALVGDIVGSRFEWHNIKSKDFDLFTPDCFFTDDSVMSLAVAKAILESGNAPETLAVNAVKEMRRLGRAYPDAGYGGRFGVWLTEPDPKPYNSFGNGAAMRVSACGFSAKSLEEALALAHTVTAVTHDHPEGLKGGEATAAAVYLAANGKSKQEIKAFVQSRYYPLDFTLDAIRPGYTFDESCQGTVPQALEAFFESTDFEDAIRLAVSLGGDSDTLAAITGGVAEAFYGVPALIREKAITYLTEDLRAILYAFESAYPAKS